MSTVRYVVLNENTLGYINGARPSYMGILHGSVLKGGHDWKKGEVILTPGLDTVRPATEADFDEYRVMVPPNFK